MINKIILMSKSFLNIIEELHLDNNELHQVSNKSVEKNVN